MFGIQNEAIITQHVVYFVQVKFKADMRKDRELLIRN